MATSAEILARLRQEQEWQRQNAWQQTPTPTPQPIPASMGRIAAPQTNYGTNANRNLPAASPMATPTPAPTRNRQAPVTPTPTIQQAGQQYQKQRYDPLSSATPTIPASAGRIPAQQTNYAPRPTATPLSPQLAPPTVPASMGRIPAAQTNYAPQATPTPQRVSTPAPASTPQPAQQSAYSLYMPTISNNPAPATRPVTQQPANRPMIGPPTKEQAGTQGSTMGRIIDRGQGIPTPPAQPAPLYNAKEVLLDYLLRTNDPEMLNRLASAAANPIQQDMTLYDAGTDMEGYSRQRQGGPGIEEVLNAYGSVPAGEPYESIWNQKPAPMNPNRSRRIAILEGGGTGDPVLDYLLRTGDPQTIARLQGNSWGRSLLARYEQLNQG